MFVATVGFHYGLSKRENGKLRRTEVDNSGEAYSRRGKINRRKRMVRRGVVE
jgi:hypothetical protein